MENARLFQETSRSLSRVQALRAIDNAITNTLDMRVTLNVLLDQVTGQLGVHAANILLFNPHLQTLEYAAGRGFDSRFQHPTRLRIGDDNVFREHFTAHRSNTPEEDTVIGSRNFLMAHSHVGHNAQLGNNIIMANGALLAGHVHVGEKALVGMRICAKHSITGRRDSLK